MRTDPPQPGTTNVIPITRARAEAPAESAPPFFDVAVLEASAAYADDLTGRIAAVLATLHYDEARNAWTGAGGMLLSRAGAESLFACQVHAEASRDATRALLALIPGYQG